MELPEKVNEVYEVISEYFGEERTDIVKEEDIYTIMIHFPEVTVSNEHDSQIKIYDLYVKLGIDADGKYAVRMKWIRASYTEFQLQSRYAHSHLPSIQYPLDWQSPCLGRGPLTTTLGLLASSCDKDNWLAFCVELDRTIQVESLSGGPYLKMEELSVKNMHKMVPTSIFNVDRDFIINHPKILTEFTKYIIDKNLLKFCFCGKFIPQENIYRLYVNFSNWFIDFYNTSEIRKEVSIYDLFNRRILIRTKLKNGIIYTYGNSTFMNHSIEGDFLFRFKDHDVNARIIPSDDNNDSDVPFTCLTPSITKHILMCLTDYVNINSILLQ
jgi:hypothetical protein